MLCPTDKHPPDERADLLEGTDAVGVSAVDETMAYVWLLEPGPKPKPNKSKKDQTGRVGIGCRETVGHRPDDDGPLRRRL